MARCPDLQTIYLNSSSYRQKFFLVSSKAPPAFSPFPLPWHTLPMPRICPKPFCHTVSTHPHSTLSIPPNCPQNISQGGAPTPILPLCALPSFTTSLFPSQRDCRVPGDCMSVQGHRFIFGVWRASSPAHCTTPLHICTPSLLLLLCHRIQD